MPGRRRRPCSCGGWRARCASRSSTTAPASRRPTATDRVPVRPARCQRQQSSRRRRQALRRLRQNHRPAPPRQARRRPRRESCAPRRRRDAPPDGKQHHQADHRPDVDRQILPAVARRRADRAVIGPGGAVDRQRERVGPRPQPVARACLLLAAPGDGEQHRHIGGHHHQDHQAGHRRDLEPACVICASEERAGLSADPPSIRA